MCHSCHSSSKTATTSNKQLITSFVTKKFRKPQTTNNNTKINKNKQYTEKRRRKVWINCIDGSINCLQSLNYALFRKNGYFVMNILRIIYHII